MKGWVYIITTRSMPDLVKVGFSTKDPDLRAAELNNTGNPHPYKVEYEVLVNEPRNVEQIAHRLLKNKDFHENKEWFNCSIELAVIAIREAADGGIFLENIRSKIFSELKIDDNDWLDELIAWADENEIMEERLPRNKNEILKMTELNLAFAKKIKSSEFFDHLTNFEKFNLKRTQLTKLPTCIGNLTNLISLNVSCNQLTELPESISNLNNLTLLGIGNNKLTKIPEFIGKMTNLTSLDISENKLTEIPGFIGDMNNLTMLHLRDNQLAEIPEFIGKLKSLTELFLGKNKIIELPESMGNLTDLAVLDLEGNLLTKVPKFIDKLTNLTELFLGENKIIVLPFHRAIPPNHYHQNQATSTASPNSNN